MLREKPRVFKERFYKLTYMQHFYAYTHKPTGNKSSYKTLFVFFGKLLLIIGLAFIVMMVNVFKSSAQPGILDPTFNAVDNGSGQKEGADKDVRSLALQADGKIIIGGTFTLYNGTTVNRIARLSSAGLLDAGFNVGTGADSTVYDILVQADGKIIMAGAFTNYNGTAAPYIIRLNTDGSKDATFNVGTGANGVINTIAFQSDGKIIAGGNFTTYNGIASNHIVRINTNGSRDAGFTGSVANSINDLAIQTDGKIVVGINNDGNGLVTNFLTRLTNTGANDATFNAGGAGADETVKVVRIQADGKILAGGNFFNYNATATRLVRTNSNGSIDATFVNAEDVSDEPVNDIVLQADGKIILTWGTYRTFWVMGLPSGKKVTRLNTNGTIDATFNYDFYPEMNENAFTVLVQPDGKLIVAETFISKWNGSTARYAIHTTSLVSGGTKDFKINRYNSNGSRDQNFGIAALTKGANRKINMIAVQADGKTIIAGNFFTFNGTVANYIARLNTDGTLDAGFNTGIGFDKPVNSILIQPDGKIIVGGVFTKYNGLPINSVARLNVDGSIDPSFSFTTVLLYNEATSLALQPDGKIMVGAASALYRINSNGTIDPGFNTVIGGQFGMFFPQVNAIVVQSDSKVLTGGDFRLSNGDYPLYRVGRHNTDGSRDASYVTNDAGSEPFVGGGASSYVYACAVQPDGKILYGGNFTSFSTLSTVRVHNNILRLKASGNIDSTFDSGGTGANGDIYAITVLPDNKIMIGGAFTTYNGIPVNRIARLNANGTLDTGFNAGGDGANGDIFSIVSINSGSRLLIAGDFTAYNATGKNRIARIFGGDAAAPVPSTTSATICASALPYVWNGNNFNATGVYTAVVNHPTGPTVDTLYLTVGAGEISGPDRGCLYVSNGTNATYQINVPAGSTVTWSVSKPTTMQVISGQGTTSAAIKFLTGFTSGNVYAQVVNTACSLNVKKSRTVSSSLPSTPTAIVAGSSSICAVIGTGTTVSYTIRKVTSAISYNWAAQAGTTTITHPNGTGINDTTVNITFASGYTTSTVSVQAVNDCGTSNTRSLTVSRSNPSAPGGITGPTNVCPYTPDLDNVFYSVTEVAGITYTWTLPAGISWWSYMNPSHSQIGVRFTAGYTSGVFSVVATNGCGISTARNITVRKLLSSTPGAITATNISACPSRQYTYSLASMPSNASTVQWTVPTGGTIVSGQGTTSITVTYTSSAISGYVSAQGINNCSSSSIRKLTVSLAVCSAPFAKGGEEEAVVAKTTIPELPVDMMEVKVFPNPSVSDFKLQVLTSAKETINVRILDIQGRLLKETKINPYQAINIGAELRTGTYLIEVRQGNNIKTSKVIKF